MYKNYIIKTLVPVFILGLLVTAVMLQSTKTSGATSGNTYYVDSLKGNDAKDGKNAAKAWKTLKKVNNMKFKPGDKILFKAGGSWQGCLSPSGSGNPSKSIVIDMYGKGSKPLIHGDGTAAGTVRLKNQSYWEINNLEVTNTSQKLGDYRGISIEGVDAGILEHIYIKNCYVHDVAGELKGFRVNDTGYELGKRTGGIVFWIDSVKGVKTKFNNILIQKNRLEYCSFAGIAFKQTNKYHWALREGGVEDPLWYPHTNILIQDNYLNQDAENCCVGILLTAVSDATIKNNVLFKPGQCGIELNYAKNCLVEQNEVDHCIIKGGGSDYCGLDFDRCTDHTVWQYNYINDCGTGVLTCHAGDKWDFSLNNTVRYNIFQNYKNYGVQIFSIGGPDYITGNIFYNDKYPGARIVGDNYVGDYDLQIEKNIFYQTVSGGTFSKLPTFSYDNNLYFGEGLGELPEDNNKVVQDPKFIDPGKGGYGDENGTAMKTLSGYDLMQDSPFINNRIPDFEKMIAGPGK